MTTTYANFWLGVTRLFNVNPGMIALIGITDSPTGSISCSKLLTTMIVGGYVVDHWPSLAGQFRHYIPDGLHYMFRSAAHRAGVTSLDDLMEDYACRGSCCSEVLGEGHQIRPEDLQIDCCGTNFCRGWNGCVKRTECEEGLA